MENDKPTIWDCCYHLGSVREEIDELKERLITLAATQAEYETVLREALKKHGAISHNNKVFVLSGDEIKIISPVSSLSADRAESKAA